MHFGADRLPDLRILSTMNEEDLAWLENVELPDLTWSEARAHQQAQWDPSCERSNRFDAIEDIRGRIDAMGRFDWACGDTQFPIEKRERIARAYFRAAAWESMASNELNEGQKAWAITQLKKKSQDVDRILGVWMASEDPHATLVRALRDAWPTATAIDIGRVVEKICDGWQFAVPDRFSKASMRTLAKRFAALATPEVVEAVLRWLPTIPDFERRVLHAGTVLASDGSERCAVALRPVLAEAEQREAGTDRAWVVGIWSRLAPKGSAVAAMLR